MRRFDGSSNRKLRSFRVHVVPAIALALGAAACGSSSIPSESERTASSREALGSLGGVTWTAQGPGPVNNGLVTNLAPNNAISGAVHVILPHPTNVNTLFAGTVNGGIWRTTNATATTPTWTALTDFQSSLSTSALTFDPANSQILVAGTGSLSALGAHGTEGGLLLSQNGGNTWTQIPDSAFATSAPIVGARWSDAYIRGNTLLANSFPFGGVFRSTNGGTSWTRITGGAGTGLVDGNEVKRIAADPTNTSRFYLSQFNQGIFISTNTGSTWTKVSQNNPALENAMHADDSGFVSNAELAVGNNARVYVAVVRVNASNGHENVAFVGFSSNQGASWTQMDLPDPQMFAAGIHLGLTADKVSPNLVYIGGEPSEQIFRGDSNAASGAQWTAISNNASSNNTGPHPDCRSLALNVSGDLLEGGDGGVAVRASPRGTGSWRGLNGNLQTLEAHDVAYDFNFHRVTAGTWDNGVVIQTATGNVTWDSFSLGDGGDVQIDSSVPGTSILYSGSDFVRVSYGSAGANSGTRIPIAQNAVRGAPPLQAQGALTGIEINRVDPRRLVFGGANFVYESFDRGDTIVSLGAGGGSHGLAYGNPDNQDVLYVAMFNAAGPDSGKVLRRLTKFDALAPTPAFFPTGDATDLVIDPRNFQKVYVIGQSDVFITTNAGASWGSAVTGNLQSALHAGVLYSIDYVRATPENILLVGADRGVFATSADAPGTWQEVGTALPNAPAFDLVHDHRDDVVAVSLLGRSTWTASALAANKAPVSICRDVTVNPGSSCSVTVNSSSVNNGSSDPNGDTFSCALSPSTGPFGLGATPVALVCTDSKGAFSSCAATVQVGAVVAPWNATTSYTAGTRVTFQGFTFMARQPSTGVMPTLPNSSPPDLTLASWEIATPCGLSAWLDETHYQVGSMVVFQGTKYVCTADHVAAFNWTPNVTTNLWRLATQSDQPTCPCP